MDYKEKVIKINENRILRYYITNGYTPMYTIKEDFIDNNKVVKNYSLNRWDDYGFNGWINTNNDITKLEKINKLSFDFDVNHPLYNHLLHLLRGDKQLLIDDDRTCGLNKKYMLIEAQENKIILNFACNIEDLEDMDILDKFNIFIKNIGPDCRSKIDCFYKDTKIRLYDFYKEVFQEQKEQLSTSETLSKTLTRINR